jgi:hypothetical protein
MKFVEKEERKELEFAKVKSRFRNNMRRNFEGIDKENKFFQIRLNKKQSLKKPEFSSETISSLQI